MGRRRTMNVADRDKAERYRARHITKEKGEGKTYAHKSSVRVFKDEYEYLASKNPHEGGFKTRDGKRIRYSD